MHYLLYLFTGLVGGLIGGLLGTGGCAVMMPVLRFWLHYPAATAVGTTLTAVVFTATSGAVQHIRLGNVDKKTALVTGLSGVIGVIIGSFIFGYIKGYGELIDFILGIAFLIVSLRMLYEGLAKNGVRMALMNDIPVLFLKKQSLG